jgi:hypothetical protein
MDIRELAKPERTVNVEEMLDIDASNESMIYNLVKKVDLRNQIITKFTEANNNSTAKRRWVDKHVYSYNVMLYTIAALAYMGYRKSNIIDYLGVTIPNVLFNVCAVTTMNEYYKKQR